MGVLLQAFYTLKGFRGLPCPLDGDRGAEFWWDHLAKQAHALRQSGFTALWLPPALKCSSGISSVGYDPFDDYDLGSKKQKGHVETRYGSREKLARCVAMLRSNGLDAYVDIVENHRDGDGQFGTAVFRYADAEGNVGDPRIGPTGGRFPKDASNFHDVPGGVAEDPNVFDDSVSFGRELAPINARPPRYVFDGLLASADWLVRALDLQGLRIDDVKGVSTDFLFPMLNHGSLAAKFAVGEFMDASLSRVQNWVSNPNGMRGRSNAFDFPLRSLITQFCNNAGFFDMSTLDHAGLAGEDPLHAVTFVENHDTDGGGFDGPIFQNKAQGYAFILTSEGYPCVFYKDYSTDSGCYGMKTVIDNLIWIHEKLAAGPTQQRWKNHDIFAYERLGGPHLLVGLNNNGIAEHTITVDTGFGANVDLHDYSGHGGNVRTDGQGKATITIPRNTNGLGFVCYSREGISGGFPTDGVPATQDSEGAQDLDIKPANATETVQICRVWVAHGKPIRGSLRYATTGWTPSTSLLVELTDSTGEVLGSQSFKETTPQGTALHVLAPTTGWFVFRIRAANTPPGRPRLSYKLTVEYEAPQQEIA
jgi:alpha-amylase